MFEQKRFFKLSIVFGWINENNWYNQANFINQKILFRQQKIRLSIYSMVGPTKIWLIRPNIFLNVGWKLESPRYKPSLEEYVWLRDSPNINNTISYYLHKQNRFFKLTIVFGWINQNNWYNLSNFINQKILFGQQKIWLSL